MNPNNLLLTTDNPLDKIVVLASGSFSVPSGFFGEYNIPHGLPYRPLPIVTWSTDPNFNVSYEATLSGYTDMNTPQLIAQSTSSNYRFIPQNYTGSNLTYYWRVFGYMPSNVNVPAPFTAIQADDFVVNTEYNYSKILREGILNWASGTQTITHGLGYRPQVEIWFEQELNADLLSRFSSGIDSGFMGTDGVIVNNNQVVFNFRSSGGVAGRRWYYIIYADTAVGI